MLKQFVVLVLLMMLCAACSNTERAPKVLSLADVRLPDPERDAIVKNHVRDINGFDTVELFARYTDARKYYGKIPPNHGSDLNAPPLLGYLIEYSMYDTTGKRTYHLMKTSPDLFCGTGIYPEFAYDSLGFVMWQGKHNQANDSFTWHMWPGANVLISAHWQVHEKNNAHITTYYLDNQGKPLIAMTYNVHSAPEDTTRYTYDAAGRVVLIFDSAPTPDDNNEHPWHAQRKSTHYYYRKNGNLDSMTRYFDGPGDYHGIRAEKRYYDESGLLQSAIIADSLHVYYINRKFSDGNEPLY